MAGTARKPEDILDVNRAWLPPSPHVDRIVQFVQAGRAYIEHRGHNLPPLVVFEDGGIIALPDVRYEDTYRGIEIISGRNSSDSEQTRHPDVCGCVDEFKGLLRDDPDSLSADPDKYRQLIEDSCYMITRMRKRIDAYRYFAAKVIETCIVDIDSPDPVQAFNSADELRARIDNRQPSADIDIDDLDRLAEEIRDIASRQEAALAEFKNMAIQTGELYKEIKGARNWE